MTKEKSNFVPFLERHRMDKIAKSTIEAELKRVAQHYGYRHFTCSEFDRVAKQCRASTVLRSFGNSWSQALASIGVSLSPRQSTRRQISDEEFFNEMERVLEILGQRPSKAEWESAEPKYSYGGIYKRFGGWLAAWEAFVEHKIGGHNKTTVLPHDGSSSMETISKQQSHTTQSRDVPLKLRLSVLKRDNFKCVLCGRSPAKNPEAELHIDHIVPFSKGGETIMDNLQTLCEKCNWGKGNSTEGL